MLSDQDRQTVENILRKYATDQSYTVVVFGSRVSGKARKYSDIDIALIGTCEIPPQTIATLAEAFEESLLPYTVDIIDGKNASSRLLEQIYKYGEELMRT